MAVTLTVEDGTGLAAANSYASEVFVTNHHLARVPLVAGQTHAWVSLSGDARRASIVDATSLLDATYQWASRILDTTQGLLLPRAGFHDGEGRWWDAARQIAAAAEAVALLAPRLAAAAVHAGGRRVVKSERIGDWSATYADEGKASHPEVDRVLKGLAVGGGLGGGMRNVKLVRWS